MAERLEYPPLTEAGYLTDGTHGFWAIKTTDGWRFLCNDPPFSFADCARQALGGLILEFGVRGGQTIREIAQETIYNVYGFDWWKGLPHDWCEGGPRGSCAAPKPTDLPKNIELVEGLFSDTLEGFLDTHTGPVALAHLDCDLYAPTLYILHALRHRFIKGSLIAFSAMCLFPILAQKRAWDCYRGESGELWEMVGKQHAWGEVWRKQ